MTDEIINEIHKHREELAKEFDYDVRKMLDFFQEKQAESGHKVVSFVKKNKKIKSDDDKKAA